jgi:chemotaxis protein CheX
MNAPGQQPNTTDSHESWQPVLQLATEEVFQTMLASQLTITPEPASVDSLDITAMVGLAGVLCGVLIIRCNSNAGTRMASKMLGMNMEEAASQICDAMGEICNMVAGNFKNKVSGMGDGCMLSVPTVITGGDYNCHSLGYSSSVRVSFLFEQDNVLIQLQIQG